MWQSTLGFLMFQGKSRGSSSFHPTWHYTTEWGTCTKALQSEECVPRTMLGLLLHAWSYQMPLQLCNRYSRSSEMGAINAFGCRRRDSASLVLYFVTLDKSLNLNNLWLSISLSAQETETPSSELVGRLNNTCCLYALIEYELYTDVPIVHYMFIISFIWIRKWRLGGLMTMYLSLGSNHTAWLWREMLSSSAVPSAFV